MISRLHIFVQRSISVPQHVYRNWNPYLQPPAASSVQWESSTIWKLYFALWFSRLWRIQLPSSGSEWRLHIPPKRWYPNTKLHDFTTQNITNLNTHFGENLKHYIILSSKHNYAPIKEKMFQNDHKSWYNCTTGTGILLTTEYELLIKLDMTQSGCENDDTIIKFQVSEKVTELLDQLKQSANC
jgi:hypothetical protein